MIARLVTLLPEPDSPTTPSVSPRRSVNERFGDRLHDPVAGPEADGEVADVEQRVRLCAQRRRADGPLAQSRVPHARIEERVDDVDDEVHDRDRGGGAEDDAEHGRQVLVAARR